jgi:O-acetyl-ADP-ribose deacetylase
MAERKIGDRVIRLVEGDITDLEIEAFVYDIDEDAQIGSGYGTAISGRAGKVVQDQLDEIGSVPKATAVITEAGRMKADHIIHVNGPKFHEPETEDKLRRATQAALTLADREGIHKLALPPIGTGLYQVPIDLCADVMVDTVAKHLQGETGLDEVVFVALNSRERTPFAARIQGGV